MFPRTAKSGASAIEADKEFQVVIVRGKKLYLRASVEEAYCLSFFVCKALVRVDAGVR